MHTGYRHGLSTNRIRDWCAEHLASQRTADPLKCLEAVNNWPGHLYTSASGSNASTGSKRHRTVESVPVAHKILFVSPAQSIRRLLPRRCFLPICDGGTRGTPPPAGAAMRMGSSMERHAQRIFLLEFLHSKHIQICSPSSICTKFMSCCC